MRTKEQILDEIKAVGSHVLPKGSHLWLYGSRARGDYDVNSDWDLLVLLNKDERTRQDSEAYSFPFWDLGFQFGEVMRPHVYTEKQWKAFSFSPFVKNVEQDKMVLI